MAEAPPSPSKPSAPPPAGDLSGQALWEAATTELIADRPLIETRLRAATFLDHSDALFTIGFHVEQGLYRDSILRHREHIQDVLSRLGGRKIELRVELSPDIAFERIDLDEPGEEDANQSGAAPETGATDAGDALPADAAPATASAPAPEPEDDFHQDPLIQQALADFEATVLKPGTA